MKFSTNKLKNPDYFEGHCLKKIVLLCLILFSVSGCSKPKSHYHELLSLSENGYGVLVTKVILHNKINKPLDTLLNEVRVNPGLPSDFTSFSTLPIDTKKLPDYLTFEYQYMDLSECKHVRESKMVKIVFMQDYSPLKKGDMRLVSEEEADRYIRKGGGRIATLANFSDSNYTKDQLINNYEEMLKQSKIYKTKVGCATWTPIESLKLVKTLDMRLHKKAKEIKIFREKNKNAAGSYYGTRIKYLFHDDGEITIALSNYTTNPWK